VQYIKTATALGGGILIFRNNDLPLTKIQELHDSYPLQGRRKYLMKVLKYYLINFLSSPRVFPLIIRLLQKKGIDYDSTIHNLSRSFPNGDFFENIRKQPSFPLLKLMYHRFKTYDFSNIEKRVERGNFMLTNLPESFLFPGQKSIVQTYWAFPILTSKPPELVLELRKAGFDATHKSSLKIVESTEKDTVHKVRTSENILNQVIFLPLYPEMPLTEFAKITGCLDEFKKANFELSVNCT
jgi:perosamine synthetase